MCNSGAKFQAIWDAIVSDGDLRVVVFSNFREEGVDGFMQWLVETQRFRRTGKREYEYVVLKGNGMAPSYEVVLWSNDHFDAITRWQHKTDNVVKILLMSPMAREGLSLKCVRQFHLMEPSWNTSDEAQAIGRAVRMTSHSSLPLSEQTVHVRHWISTYSGGQTADERLVELASMRAAVVRPYLRRLQFIGDGYRKRLEQELQSATPTQMYDENEPLIMRMKRKRDSTVT